MVKKTRTNPNETIQLSFKGFKHTQDYLFLLGLIVVLVLQYSYLSDLHQLPSPLYGGDQYFHYGHVLHLYQGGSPFDSSHYLGEYEHYPWLTHLVIAFLSWILFTNPLTVTLLWFPLFTTILAGFFSYQLGKKLFTNQWISLLFSLYWITLLIPNLGPSMIATYVMLPLLAFSFLSWEKPRNRVYSGIIYGLDGLQHATLFIGTSFFFALRFLYDLGHSFIQLEKSKLRITKKPFLPEVWSQIKRYLPVFGIGIALALLYWWAPIFIYHGKTLNPWQEYSGQGVNSLTLGLVMSNLYHTVVNTGDWSSILISLFALIGVYATYQQKKLNPAWTFWAIGVFGLAHPWITQPLLGTSFGFYRFSVFLTIPHILFLFYGAHYIIQRFPKPKAVLYGVCAVLILLTIFQAHQVFNGFSKDVWTQTGKDQNPYTNALIQFGEWAQTNTDHSKSALSSHGETAFAYHSLTGNKVVSLRRTHSNPYANENKRIADSAVMLYGKDLSNVRELLQRYHVAYLYEDAQSVQNRAICNGLWQNFSRGDYVDQMYSCLQTSPEYGTYLHENGIETQGAHVRLDISDPNAPQFDMLLIKPTDFNGFNLTPIQTADVGGKAGAILFGIKMK
ncbi:MAG: hypothetical protein AABX70_08900 [Nanoarchaeota archaeon]